MTDELSRRHAIKLGAASVGLGAMGSLAGCSSIPFIGGGGSYTAWLPAPGAIESGADAYSFTSLDTKKIRNNEDKFKSDAYDSVSNTRSDQLDSAGLDFDDTDSMLLFQSVTVVDGSFKKNDVTGELEDNNFSDDTDHEGYTIYLSESEFRAVGVKDGTLVYGRESGDTGAVDVVETAIDTKKGNEDRYKSENEDFKELQSSLGSGTTVSGGTSSGDSDRVASGSTLSINGDTADLEYVVVFEDSDAVPTDQIDKVEEQAKESDRFSNFSVSTNGRTVEVSYERPTDELGAGTITGGASYGF